LWQKIFLKKKSIKLQPILFNVLETKSELSEEEYPVVMSTGLVVGEARGNPGFIDRLVDTSP
jgi:hypothetical protein